MCIKRKYFQRLSGEARCVNWREKRGFKDKTGAVTVLEVALGCVQSWRGSVGDEVLGEMKVDPEERAG